jgi:hypothetical protein
LVRPPGRDELVFATFDAVGDDGGILLSRTIGVP